MNLEEPLPVTELIPGQLYAPSCDPRVSVTFMELADFGMVKEFGVLSAGGAFFQHLPPIIMFLGWVEIPQQVYCDRAVPNRLAECLVGERKMLLCQYFVDDPYSTLSFRDAWEELQLFSPDKEKLDD